MKTLFCSFSFPFSLAKRFHNGTGYTLVELLVVIAIMGILMATGSAIFISILRSNTKTATIDQVREQGNKAIDLMTTSIQNGAAIVKPADDASHSNDGLCFPELIIKNKLVNTGSGLSYSNSVGANAYTRFELVPQTASANGYIALDSSSTSVNLDSSQATYLPFTPITINSLTSANAVSVKAVAGYGPASASDPNAPCFIIRHSQDGQVTVVRVQFTLQQSVSAPTDRQEYIGEVPFSSSFELRNY